MVRPKVVLCNGLSEDTAAAWDGIKKANQRMRDPQVFLFGDDLIWLLHAQDGLKTRSITPQMLRRFATDHINFFKLQSIKHPGEEDELLEVAADPKLDLFTNMLAGPPPDLPRLSTLVHVPVFSQHGLVINPGYSEDSGIYYEADTNITVPEVPEHPNSDEIAMAKEFLLTEFLGDFPFNGSASKAHAVAAIIQPFVRSLIPGTTPLYPIIKPKSGTGASLLAQEIARIFATPILFSLPASEAEQSYTLIAYLLEMPGSLILDNVQRLDGRTLASVLTSTRVTGRIIGSSRTVKVENQATWFATGNNPDFSDEIARRSVPILLDAGVEHPDQRSDFRHPDLLDWAHQNRSWLIWSALTLIQSWFDSGRPLSKKILGGYQTWAGVIGGILEHAGIDGFLDNLTSFRNRVDSKSTAFADFVEQWAARHGTSEVTAGQLLPCATTLDLGTGENNGPNKRLGRLLQEREGQRFSNWTVQRGRLANGYQLWRLEAVQPEGM